MTKRYERYRTYHRNLTRYIKKSVRVRRQLERVDAKHSLARLFDLDAAWSLWRHVCQGLLQPFNKKA